MVFGTLSLLLFASWRQCTEKSASISWEMRVIFRNTQFRNIIKGLKINLKYKLQKSAEYAIISCRYNARHQTVMFDADYLDYLLQVRIERKTDQILLKTI